MNASLIRDRYEPLDVVGRGGQGEVVRAIDRRHDRLVALKVRRLRSDFERKAVLAEARVLLSLRPHPGLPVVREDFFLDDRYFIAMDWVDGVRLGRVLEDRGSPGLPLPEVVEYISQTSEALDHLHGHQPPIVHGDVKPSNLILLPDGRVVLVDFGLSARGGMVGRRGGTQGYAAPELAAGLTQAISADIYGLAATAFALLTGHPPRGDPPAWENVPAGAAARIEPVIRRALSIDPDRRPAGAGEFAAGLATAARVRSGSGFEDAGGEVRTFLVADIRGYTRLRRAHGDEHAARLAAVFAEIAREGVEARGGTVIEVRSNEAVAAFSSTHQALRAAAELQSVFADESELDPRLPLSVGMGLDAGEAVPVEGGYRGAAINLAAQLCSRAGPGEVLTSPGVVHLAQAVEGLRLEEGEDLLLKGLDGPVRAWRVWPGPDGRPAVTDRGNRWVAREALREIRDLPPELDPMTPLVGRDRESRWIRWAWRCARRGRGRAVCISGVEGSGRTRLAAEAAAIAVGEGAWIGYCSAKARGEDLGEVVAAAHAEPGPSVLVLDDLQAARPDELAVIAEFIDELGDRPTLLVTTLSADAPPRIKVTLERLIGAVGGESHRHLGPLDREAVRAVVRLYAEEAAAIPVEAILEATGGVAEGVHRMASQWARGRAARQLGEVAGRAAKSRRHQRTIEAQLAHTVIDLQAIRERTELFVEHDRTPERRLEAAPYKGLAGYEVDDGPFFFGRERLVAEMVARLAGLSFLGVVGPSGSGKSSAVRAGLVPALSAGALPGSEEWIRVLLRPGEHPSGALQRQLYAALPERLRAGPISNGDPLSMMRTLPRDQGHVLLVIDQFEELFTACRDEEERRRYVDSLVAAVRERARVTVVVAIRADFYGSCAAHPELADLLGANHVLVGPMTSAEYTRAVELPARKAGLRIDRPLIDALVAEVEDEPGGLPLLSTALLELWHRRQGRAIRMEAYTATGGVRGAVARLAEDAWDRLSEEQRTIARSVLLRLSAGEGEAVVRRRVPLGEFDVQRNHDVAAVLAVLTEARLLTVSDGAVEVAHEALLREWPRLRGWLEEDQESRRLRVHLMETASAWAERARDRGDLYRGARLASALDWSTRHASELNLLEREFLEESRSRSELEADRQRRINRRLRGLLSGVAVLLVVALVAGSLAAVQRGRARRAAERAEQQAVVADARRLATQSLSEERLDRSLQLALAATRLDDSPESRSALFAGLLRSPAAIGVVPGTGKPLLGLAITRDGRTLAMASNEGDITFVDIETRRQIGDPLHLDGFIGAHSAIAFDPGGETLAVAVAGQGAQPSYVDLINVRRRTVDLHVDLGELSDALVLPETVTFSPNGDILAFSIREYAAGASPFDKPLRKVVVLLHPSTGERIGELAVSRPEFGRGGMLFQTFLPDGKTLVTSADEGTTTLWDLETMRRVWTERDRGGPLAVTADGRWAAVGGNGVISLFNLRTGSWRAMRDRHRSWVTALAFTRDGGSLVSTSDDGTAIAWNVPTRRVRERFEGHAGSVSAVALSPDGHTAYTAGDDGMVILWDLQGGRRLGRELDRGVGACCWSQIFALSPDGTTLAIPRDKGSITLWDVDDLAPIGELAGPYEEPTNGLSFSPDGRTLAATGGYGRVVLWDVEAMSTIGEPFRLPEGQDGWWTTFSPDGSMLAASASPPSGQASTNIVWDVASRRVLKELELVPGGAWEIDFSPDGRFLSAATCCESGVSEVRVFEVAGWREIAFPKPEGLVGHTDFSPDGRVLAIPGSGKIGFWDVSSGTQVGPPITGLGDVWGFAFSPDGRVLAADVGGRILLWDMQSRTEIGPGLPTQDFSAGVEFTPDGRHVVVVQTSERAFVWDVDPDSWERHACMVVGRDLTPEEWRDLLPAQPYERLCPQ